jgi:hypothetical protein
MVKCALDKLLFLDKGLMIDKIVLIIIMIPCRVLPAGCYKGCSVIVDYCCWQPVRPEWLAWKKE